MDELIEEKKAAVNVAQAALDAARAACDHDFEIVSQCHRIIEQTSIHQGEEVFVQQNVCHLCGHEARTQSRSPICLDCKTTLVIPDVRDVKEHRIEFERSFDEVSRDSGSGWSGRAQTYRCPSCGRAHAYGLEGD